MRESVATLLEDFEMLNLNYGSSHRDNPQYRAVNLAPTIKRAIVPWMRHQRQRPSPSTPRSADPITCPTLPDGTLAESRRAARLRPPKRAARMPKPAARLEELTGGAEGSTTWRSANPKGNSTFARSA